MRPIVGALSAGLAMLVGLGPVVPGSTKEPRPFPIVFESTLNGGPLGDAAGPLADLLPFGDGGLYIAIGPKVQSVADADSPGHDCGPAFSPNGRSLVFESNRLARPFDPLNPTAFDPFAHDPYNFELYTLDLRTHALKRLTRHKGVDVYPSWSPDGRTIAFTREQPKGRLSIWVTNADGSGGPRQLTWGDDRLAHVTPAWSPDGTKIAYTVADSQAGAAPAIYVMDADGSNQRMLTDDGELPAWSPDGRWIVFDSARDAVQPTEMRVEPLQPDLYVMRSDGTRVRSLGARPGADMMPTWSPDGVHIAYVNDPDGWAGGDTLVLWTGDGVDAYRSGPEEAHVWMLDLRNLDADPVEVSHGKADFFPHYSPVRDIG